MGCETVATKSSFFFPPWLQQPHYWPENIHPPPGGSKIGVFKFIATFIPLIVMQYPFSLLPKVKKLRTPNFSRLTRLFLESPVLFSNGFVRGCNVCILQLLPRRVISLSGTHSNIATVRCYVKGKRIRVAAAASTL